jgi:hypothetical protein
LQKFQVADGSGEHVVEIVRESACELPNRLHLLGLAQRRLGRGAAPASSPEPRFRDPRSILAGPSPLRGALVGG